MKCQQSRGLTGNFPPNSTGLLDQLPATFSSNLTVTQNSKVKTSNASKLSCRPTSNCCSYSERFSHDRIRVLTS